MWFGNVLLILTIVPVDGGNLYDYLSQIEKNTIEQDVLYSSIFRICIIPMFLISSYLALRKTKNNKTELTDVGVSNKIDEKEYLTLNDNA